MSVKRPKLAFHWTTFLLCLHAAAAEVAPTGTGSAYASRCNAAKQDWVLSQGRTFVSESTYNSTTSGFAPSTSITTLTFLSSNETPYTLCDGYPRINGSRTISTISVTTPWTSTFETSSSVFRDIPQPTCIIQSSDCARLQNAYTSSLQVYSSWESQSSVPHRRPDNITPPPYPTSPICGSATLTPFTSAVGQAACAMQEASVRLLYWPVTVANTCDSCHRSACPTTTLGPTISGQPNIFRTLNTTLTSPTVYIEFEGSWAYTSKGTTYSSPQTLIIAQKPDAVSSHCGQPGGGYGPPRKVNYANFNNPVPADVYRCQPSCFMEPMPYTYANVTNTFTYSLVTTTTIKTVTRQSYISEASSNLCSTIWNDYAPVLAIPEAFKNINPAGFQEPGSLYGDDNPCNFIFNEDAVLFDPPLALTEQSQEATPTLPNVNSAYPTSEQEAPTAVPVQTSEPKVTALPESLGITLPSNGPVATVYTEPNPASHPSKYSHPPPAIGDVIASVLGMTTKAQGQDGQDSRLTLAMASDGSGVVINGVTTAFPGPDSPSTDAVGQETVSMQTGMVTVDASTIGYTNSDGTLVIGDKTLTPGGSVVVTVKATTSSHASRRESTTSGSPVAQTTSQACTMYVDLWKVLAIASLLTTAISLTG